MTSLLRDTILRNWWVFALRGVLAVCFGILAFVRPEISLAALVTMFGAYALVDGIMMLFATPILSGTPIFWWAVLDGVVGIAVGVLTCLYPVAAAVSLLYLLGAWLVVAGLFRIGLAIELRKQIYNEWFYVLGGLLSVAAGAMTLLRPGPSALAWLWVIGFYAILYGVAMVAVGIKLHQIGTQLPKATAAS